MEKRFRLVDAPPRGDVLYAENFVGYRVFLGYIQSYSINGPEEREVGLRPSGDIVTEVIRPARVKFTLDTGIIIECPIEAVER